MESIKCPVNDNIPRDTFKIAYIIHFLLGAGNLLPWNSFITAVDHFSHLYPNKNVEKVFSVAYMSSSLLALVLMMSCCWGKKVNYKWRMNLGFCLFIGSVMVPPLLDWLGTKGGYVVMVAAVVVCGVGDGLVGGSLIGGVAKLPKEYMQAVFAGTASSGVLVSILRIITKASLPQTPRGLKTSAHFYFIVSATILLCCLICSNLVYKLPIMQHHYNFLLQNSSFSPAPKFWTVGRKIKQPAFAVLTIYTITLSIFPGFIGGNLKSKSLQDWYPVLLVTVYNLSDFVGKSLTAMYLVKSIKMATWGCVGRILFYPLFAVCLRGGPEWLKSEAPMLVATFLLGLSNGYMTSVVMILAPKSVPVAEAELAAIVMAVFLGIGLAVGSVLGWFWNI